MGWVVDRDAVHAYVTEAIDRAEANFVLEGAHLQSALDAGIDRESAEILNAQAIVGATGEALRMLAIADTGTRFCKREEE